MDIKIKSLEHRYQARSPFERLALYDINITIKEGTYVSIIGHTGSGKSTILQHLNGLLKPTKGSIQIGDYMIQSGKKHKDLKAVRKLVGIVFQFPEHQLFEETVEKDIAFGPMNFGVSEKEAILKARQCLEIVGLPESILKKSPFDLSGGQMRRVAIAGVLAMGPEVLVLDEPTAGLDPKGRKEIMDLFYRLHKEQNLTIILVTHSMEDAAKYSDEIIVMHKGTVAMQGSPREVFNEADKLASLGLDLPETVKLQQLLADKGLSSNEISLTLDETVKQIKALIGEVVSK
ncbi:energy-coupling factor ABC transporter ATP-binding protein [Metabacillus sediminilitoris]|uniref:Energy-coupling factor transporter ATP-binding protein EcfA2 n=1 Tax=Metabacillus sediminilitoris TaxID=2567941 RepID=A0A4S4BPY5_9BACI|nr:energy-coupling factor ABC transporter ATP-binding protein [Metabacillus sediminilitoris]QGQ44022.1 energy-coupling factor ABC transporter ATP-binding protein [Metabacillus sediminilitoris]THF76133.1 energy-coupling factor ABC transporter ATP-binding protein [Metabacillus sediminilitoris]